MLDGTAGVEDALVHLHSLEKEGRKFDGAKEVLAEVIALSTAAASKVKIDNEKKVVNFLKNDCSFFVGEATMGVARELIDELGPPEDIIKALQEIGVDKEVTTAAELVALLQEDSVNLEKLVDILGGTDLFDQATEVVKMDDADLMAVIALGGDLETTVDRIQAMDECSRKFGSLAELMEVFKTDDVEFEKMLGFLGESEIFANVEGDLDISEAALTRLLILTGGGDEAVEQLRELDSEGAKFANVDEIVNAIADVGGEGDEGDEAVDAEMDAVMEYLNECDLFDGADDIDIDEDDIANLLDTFGGSSEAAIVQMKKHDAEGARFTQFSDMTAAISS